MSVCEAKGGEFSISDKSMHYVSINSKSLSTLFYVRFAMRNTMELTMVDEIHQKIS